MTTKTVCTAKKCLVPIGRDSTTTIVTTDEKAGSFLAAYDISKPTEPKLVDKIRTEAGENAVVHNTHVLGNYAVASWYSEGVVVTDVSRSHNMVNVGQFDTYDGSLGNYVGCWGVYPYLPSGNWVISNKEGEFFVVTPTYKRACYLEGIVTDSITKQPINNVSIKIKSKDFDKNAVSNLKGEYFTGQVSSGLFEVTYSKLGYKPKTVAVDLKSAQVTLRNIELTSGTSSNRDVDNNWMMYAYPNPFTSDLTIDYQLDGLHGNIELTMSDVSGSVKLSKKLVNTEGVLTISEYIPQGVYFLKITTDVGSSKTIRVVKL
jgi:Carboxypeptidase regulatory-like domain/Secretion system C-terminal sorting domain